MAIPSGNSNLYRRIRLYVFGFLIGILVVKFMYKGKSCQMPGSQKMQELTEQNREFTSFFECQLAEEKLTKDDLNNILAYSKINYNKSNVHNKPYGIYMVEGKLETGKSVEIQISDKDTISSFISIEIGGVKKENCK